MPKIAVKEKLLRCLFEAPKTTGTLARELGYSNLENKKSGETTIKYQNISHQLKELELEGFLKSEIDISKPRHGPPPTYYSIVYDISVLTKMMDKYPGLIPEMQKKDEIIGFLVDRYISSFDSRFWSNFQYKDFYAEQLKLDLKRSAVSFKQFMKNEGDMIFAESLFVSLYSKQR